MFGAPEEDRTPFTDVKDQCSTNKLQGQVRQIGATSEELNPPNSDLQSDRLPLWHRCYLCNCDHRPRFTYIYNHDEDIACEKDGNMVNVASVDKNDCVAYNNNVAGNHEHEEHYIDNVLPHLLLVIQPSTKQRLLKKVK